MKRIDVKYAIIYIDLEGKCLAFPESGYCTAEIISSYYRNLGETQWNHYVLIPAAKLSTLDDVEAIQSNDYYARKIIVVGDMDTFVKVNFPELGKQLPKVIIYEADEYKKLSDRYGSEPYENDRWIPSFLREVSGMKTLIHLDALRVQLIKNPQTIVFCTHIDAEIGWLKKKFAFLGQNLEHIIIQ